MRPDLPHLLVMTVLAPALLSGCDLIQQKLRYRYVLTMTLRTPAGLRVGHGVIEVIACQNGGTVFGRLRGQAVHLPLDRGGLFGLLKSVDGFSGAYAAAAFNPGLPQSVVEDPDWRVRFRAVAGQTGERLVPKEHYPLIAYFPDLANPDSVRLVGTDDVHTVLGKGYAIERVTARITQDAPTDGLEEILPWLKDRPLNAPVKSSQSIDDNSPVARLKSADFVVKS